MKELHYPKVVSFDHVLLLAACFALIDASDRPLKFILDPGC